MKWMRTVLLTLFLLGTAIGQDSTPVAVPKKKVDEKKDDKKAEKKEDDDAPPPVKISTIEAPQPSVGSTGSSAYLPVNLVKNTLEQMKTGGQGYVAVSTVKVDANRRCWLHPYALFSAKSSSDKPIQIRKDTAGYHMIIEETNHQWEAENFDQGAVKYLPVQTITAK